MAKKNLEVLLCDIPDEGLKIEANQKDLWLSSIIDELLPDITNKGDEVNATVNISKFEHNVNIDGVIRFTCHPFCDRCLSKFDKDFKVRFHTVLAPLYETEKQREREEGLEIELVKDDLEFGFYEGDRFDLDEIVREQIVLAQPMKWLCKDDCKGLCQKCGIDLNNASCTCKKGPADARWTALKGL